MKRLLWLLFALPLYASAQETTYDYSGLLMYGTATVCNESCAAYPPPFNTQPVTGPVTDAINWSITLAAPLGDNLNNVAITPVAMIVSNTFGTGFADEIVPGYGSVGPLNTLTNLTLNFSTNASGIITGWDTSISAYSEDCCNMSLTSTPTGDSASGYSFSHYDGEYERWSTVNTDGGSWSVAAAAPEIDASGALTALTLLAGLLAVVRGRRVA